jgi:tetratricopeptide (TPR) repeat protein
VLCCVYNRQSIDGSASVVRSILQGRAETKREPLKLEFVPCRVEDRGTVDAARRYTTLRLGAVLKEDRNRIEKNLRRAEIRHYPWCAFEEKLAVFEELPDERGSLLDVVHELAARITGTKDLRIKAYDRDLLDSYWQRVAFDDPRLIDLTAISEEAPEDAWRRLHLWLREANSDENQRPDWLMSLAEQTMGFVARRGMKLPPDEREFACRVAEASARHAFQADPDFYGPRFALVLHARAAQYLEARQLIQASVAIRNAIGLLQKEQSPTLRWRLGRSLERCGDILSAREDHAGALEAYQHALRTYQERNNRVSIAGTEFDIVRTMRLSAGAQVLLGNLDAGNGSIRSAARLLISVPMSAVERDASEAVRIFKARLRIAAQAEGAEFEKTCRWVQEAARKLLSPTALSEVDLDIVVVRAQRLSQAGRWHDALLILDESPPEFRWDPTIVTLRLRTMMADGSMKEARDYLAQAVKEHKIAMVPDLLNVAQELLINDGDSSSFADLLTSWLESGDEPSDRLLTPLFRNVLAHSNVSGDIDHAKLISLLELLTKRDR